MNKILVIESSPALKESFSNKLSQTLLGKIQTPGGSIKVRDLIGNLPPLLTTLEFGKYSDEAIAELMEADSIIVNVPMHNYGIPAVLKAWIDQIARAGHTFSFTSEGPKGLVTKKKVYLVIASGAVMSQYPASDFTEPYLKTVLGFMGMTDVKTFRIEGIAIPGIKKSAFEKALESVQNHF